MLGEISLVSGAATEVYGTKSYAPQSPWIQSGTLRENILFGKQMDKIFYENVLDGCALHYDIKIWSPYGDLTPVEERGINLSGGQKQRIQLARAVYNDSHIYFLNDPFSAIIHTLWKSLAFNAVLAGVNTISSYIGPLLMIDIKLFKQPIWIDSCLRSLPLKNYGVTKSETIVLWCSKNRNSSPSWLKFIASL